jgi:putative endonuclease
MKSTTEKGREAEQIALNFLVAKGYEIIAQNYRAGKGEIDLVAQDGNLIVFVEVKSRKNTAFGYPEMAVSPQKERLLQRTAEAFLTEKNLLNDIRFDIISISGTEIEHFEDAF